MKLLYLEGDPSGVRYVSGTLTRLGVVHEVVRPGGLLPRDLSRFQAIALSDFPFAALHSLAPLIARAVEGGGLGLLMVGGLRSFARGGYAGSVIADLLPVNLEPGDDRVKVPSGLLLQPAGEHPILRGLQFTQLVAVAGHNRVRPRPGTSTALVGRRIEGGVDGIRLGEARVPLLVLEEARGTRGRTAALATDLAPHWSAGLTDWGCRTISIGEDDEVGDSYVTLVMNLVRWIAGEDTIRRPLPPWEELTDLPAFEPRPNMRVGRDG